DAGGEPLARLRRPRGLHQPARGAAARRRQIRMIRLAETTADFELCTEIYAQVEPEARVTVEQQATALGVLLVSGRDGYAYVARSSVESSSFPMVRVRPSARGRGVGSA